MRSKSNELIFTVCAVTLSLTIGACQGNGGMPMSPFDHADMFGGPREGHAAPNFRLQTLDGETVELASVVQQGKPVVLEFGSYTCPIFRGNHPAMEKLYKEYKDQASFLMVYVIEPHPSGDPSPGTGREWVTAPNKMQGILYRQPRTDMERRKVASDAQQALNITLPIAIDNMQNTTWRTYGYAPNCAYLIGTDGRVKVRQGWFKPGKFKKTLVQELTPPA